MAHTEQFSEYLNKLKPAPIVGATKQAIFDAYVRHVANKGLPVEVSYDSLTNQTSIRLVNETTNGACTPLSWALGVENRKKIKKAICPATGWNQWKEKNLIHLLFVDAARYSGDQQNDRSIPAIDLRDRYLEMMSSKTSALVVLTPEIGFLAEIHMEVVQEIEHEISSSGITWYNYEYPLTIKGVVSRALEKIASRHSLSRSVLDF